jgi:hypothetical protein
MTDADRQFLTEAMGETYHDYVILPPRIGNTTHCGLSHCSCGITGYAVRDICAYANRTFDNWQDFGAVWEWAKKQEWFARFVWEVVFVQSATITESMELAVVIAKFCNAIDKVHFPELILAWLREQEKEE